MTDSRVEALLRAQAAAAKLSGASVESVQELAQQIQDGIRAALEAGPLPGPASEPLELSLKPEAGTPERDAITRVSIPMTEYRDLVRCAGSLSQRAPEGANLSPPITPPTRGADTADESIGAVRSQTGEKMAPEGATKLGNCGICGAKLPHATDSESLARANAIHDAYEYDDRDSACDETVSQVALRFQRLADEFCEFNPYAKECRTFLYGFVGWLAGRGSLSQGAPEPNELPHKGGL